MSISLCLELGSSELSSTMGCEPCSCLHRSIISTLFVPEALPVEVENPLHDGADPEELTTLVGEFALELVGSSPVLALTFFTAVGNLALLTIANKAVNATRAALKSRLGALCALAGWHLVVVHGCGWRSDVLTTVRR